MSRAHSYSHSRAHSPSFPSFHLRHSSFSNASLAFPTPQLIIQPFRCFTYVTAHSPILISLLLRHRIFTYVTWRAAHGKQLTAKSKMNHKIQRLHISGQQRYRLRIGIPQTYRSVNLVGILN